MLENIAGCWFKKIVKSVMVIVVTFYYLPIYSVKQYENDEKELKK